jgi:hypothetical protein
LGIRAVIDFESIMGRKKDQTGEHGSKLQEFQKTSRPLTFSEHQPSWSGMRGPLADEARNALIQRRAYEFYLKRGKQPGHEVEDWLRAEAEVREWEETQKFG